MRGRYPFLAQMHTARIIVIRYVYDHCDVDYANAVCYENAKLLLTGALG